MELWLETLRDGFNHAPCRLFASSMSKCEQEKLPPGQDESHVRPPWRGFGRQGPKFTELKKHLFGLKRGVFLENFFKLIPFKPGL
jgi:hypothetical protein